MEANTDLEMQFDASFKLGCGTDTTTGAQKSSPFLDKGAEHAQNDDVIDDVRYSSKFVNTTSDYADALEITADASYSGFGVKARAQFAMNKSSTINRNSTYFLCSKKVRFQYEGWS